MLELAHFTASELPSLLAVLLFGIAIGAATALRRQDGMTLVLVAICGLTAAGAVVFLP